MDLVGIPSLKCIDSRLLNPTPQIKKEHFSRGCTDRSEDVMQIFFQDPDDIPVPPDEVKIRSFSVQPHPDGRRVKVYLEITPFQKRPNAEIHILSNQGVEVATVSVIETVDPRLDITMHLRGSIDGGEYTVRAILFYSHLDLEEESGEHVPPGQAEIQIVDQAEAHFTIDERGE
jgi:hypothetical protein